MTADLPSSWMVRVNVLSVIVIVSVVLRTWAEFFFISKIEVVRKVGKHFTIMVAASIFFSIIYCKVYSWLRVSGVMGDAFMEFYPVGWAFVGIFSLYPSGISFIRNIEPKFLRVPIILLYPLFSLFLVWINLGICTGYFNAIPDISRQ